MDAIYDKQGVTIYHNHSLFVLMGMASDSVDSIVTDPPYGLSFMGKKWDYNVPSVQLWREALRVLKPGGHLLSFAGSRTYHRMAVNIEDAGFEIRDQIMWIYGSGFPKSLDISKAIDKAAGVEREVVGKHKAPAKSIYTQGEDELSPDVNITAPATEAAKQWDGWGTALKPSHEPLVLARKPLTVVPNNVIIDLSNLIGVTLWELLSSARRVEVVSLLSQAERKEGLDFARVIANIYHILSLQEKSEKTDMSKSQAMEKTILSIAELWSEVLTVNYSRQNKFTMSMALSLTTELKTLKCLLSASIPNHIIKEKLQAFGAMSNASNVEENSNAEQKHCPETISVQEAVMLLTAQSDATSAEKNFMPVARIANTVLLNAITNLEEKVTPAHEPIVVARKPISGTVAENVLKHGTGGINIDGTRIGDGGDKSEHWGVIDKSDCNIHEGGIKTRVPADNSKGRFPANIIFDAEAGAILDKQSGTLASGSLTAEQQIDGGFKGAKNCYGDADRGGSNLYQADSGGASRFFYCAKASKEDRDEGLEGTNLRNNHPTVKPVDLMQYLVRLVTPPDGTVLDPFMGSGSTGKAAVREGFKFIGCDREAEYIKISIARIEAPAQVELL